MSGPRRESGEDPPHADPPGQQVPGVPLHEFHPGRTKRLVVGALGVVTLGCGIVSVILIWDDGLRANRGPLAMVFAAGVMLLMLAFVIGSRRVLITSSEVIRVRGREQASCRWEEVTEVVLTSIKVRLTTLPVCALVRKDGSRFELRELDGADDESLLAALRREAEARRIPWRREPGVAADRPRE